MAQEKRIACFGSGKGESGQPISDEIRQAGFLLARQRIVVVTGGFGGADMEAPARGAHEAGGTYVGYTIFGRPGDEFLTHSHNCSRCGPEKLPVEMRYAHRLGKLLSVDDFIVAAKIESFTLFALYVLSLFRTMD